MDELTARLQKASSAVYLAAEKPVADDISAIMKEALRELASVNEQLQSCREENERLREGIEQAHMAGQHNAGVDPSYSEAQMYRIKVTEGV